VTDLTRLRGGGTRKHPWGLAQTPPEAAESHPACRRLPIEPRISSWELQNRVEINVQDTSGYFRGVLRLSIWVQEDQDRVAKAMLSVQETD